MKGFLTWGWGAKGPEGKPRKLSGRGCIFVLWDMLLLRRQWDLQWTGGSTALLYGGQTGAGCTCSVDSK